MTVSIVLALRPQEYLGLVIATILLQGMVKVGREAYDVIYPRPPCECPAGMRSGIGNEGTCPPGYAANITIMACGLVCWENSPCSEIPRDNLPILGPIGRES
jgi:hypothetical protein